MIRLHIHILSLTCLFILNAALNAEEPTSEKKECPPEPLKKDEPIKNEPRKDEPIKNEPRKEELRKEEPAKPDTTCKEDEPKANEAECKKNESSALCERKIGWPSLCNSFSVYSWISQTEGRGIGYERGYTSFGAFFVHHPYEAYFFQPYLDVRDHYHFFRKRQGAVNIGLGTRTVLPFIQKVVGGGLYYDFRRNRGSFHQASLSLEMLGYDYDLRFNAYWPFVSSSHHYKALSGLDAEVGLSLNRWCAFPWLNVYMAAGPYYYWGKGECSSFVGGRARLSFNINVFSFELRATNDSCFGKNLQGVLAINFVYGQPCLPCKNCCWRDWLQTLMTLPVYRNESIVLSEKRKKHCH